MAPGLEANLPAAHYKRQYALVLPPLETGREHMPDIQEGMHLTASNPQVPPRKGSTNCFRNTSAVARCSISFRLTCAKWAHCANRTLKRCRQVNDDAHTSMRVGLLWSSTTTSM